MRGIRYGFSFFVKNIWSNLFIAFEIALLLVASNALLGFYNNISVLYTPYQDIFTHKGVMYFSFAGASKDTEAALQQRAEAFDKLKGEPKIYYSNTNVYLYNDTPLLVHIINDEIYDAFCYAVSSGSFEPGCAVVSYMSGLKQGDTLKTANGEVRVSGVLTETTYFPQINGGEYIEDLYVPYKSGGENNEFIIMSESSAEKLYGEFDWVTSELIDTVLISYKGLSEKDIEYNNSVLEQTGELREIDKMNERTVAKLREQYARFLPFIYIISIAVIIGIISFCIVTSLDNKADMDILYNCGAGSVSLFFVMLGKNLCIVISSVLFAAIALIGMKLTGVFANNGIRLMDNLLPCSALIIGCCIVMCQLVSTLSNLTFWRKVK